MGVFFFLLRMSKVMKEVPEANAVYAKGFTKGGLPLPPARKFAVLGCMDARLDTAKALGLEEGDAHVIRNAGGRASDDAIRSLVISSRLLGTEEYFVVHHTDCGMTLFNDEVMSSLLEEPTAPHTLPELSGQKQAASSPGSSGGKYIKWLTFTDEEGAVIEDVNRIASSSRAKGHQNHGLHLRREDGQVERRRRSRKEARLKMLHHFHRKESAIKSTAFCAEK